MTPSSSPRTEFISGIRAELPLLLGAIPFGMIYGVLALDAGFSPLVVQAMSAIVLAGSSQFVAVQLVAAASPLWIILLTTFVVNLRHLLYSASVAPYMTPLGTRWKAVLAYLLTDEAYAVAIARYQAREISTHKHWFFLGAGLALWVGWQASTAAGIFLGARVPGSWSLDFAGPLTFIAIVVSTLKDRAGVSAAISAGAVATLAAGLPLKLGLILGALAGLTAGLALERKTT